MVARSDVGAVKEDEDKEEEEEDIKTKGECQYLHNVSETLTVSVSRTV